MKTLFDKIWDRHVVRSLDEETDVLWIDTHYIHEVTSPQAFQAIKDKGVKVFRPEQTVATADHNVPTINQHLPIEDPASKFQVETLKLNCEEQGIELFGLGHEKNGIVHVVGPEQGFTQPGMTIVCGDSHTSTHGAFGAIAFGIGTSQVAQVLASQSVLTSKPKSMLIKVDGSLKAHVTAKDVVLHLLKELGTNVGTGYFIEFAGSTIESLSMEGRMTICNMSIELGARGGLIAPDDVTSSYLKRIAKNEQVQEFEWHHLFSDSEDCFDESYSFSADDIDCTITYGTNPGMGVQIDEEIAKNGDENYQEALSYMGLDEQVSMEDLEVDYVFIGSCTNGRFEDFKIAAQYVRGKHRAKNVKALLVPGSNEVLREIKASGLDQVYRDAGFEIREPGCSACLAMNGDSIPEGKYCVSTSNRNFEGRQGKGARTILASPIIAAITAIEGKITHPEKVLA